MATEDNTCGVCGGADPVMCIGECDHDILCYGCFLWRRSYYTKLVTYYADLASRRLNEKR